MSGTNAPLVYIALRVIQGMEGNVKVFPASNARVASMCNISLPTVASARNRLIRLGLVERVSSGHYMLVGIPWDAWGDKKSPIKKLYRPQVSKIPGSSVAAKATKATNAARSSTLRRVKNLDERLSTEERREIVREACRILGVKESMQYVRYALGKATAQLNDGATPEELLEVVRWHRKEWDAGRERWRGSHNLMFLWGLTQFPALLACARAKPVDTSRREYRVPGGGADDPVWSEAQREKVARRQKEAEAR